MPFTPFTPLVPCLVPTMKPVMEATVGNANTSAGEMSNCFASFMADKECPPACKNGSVRPTGRPSTTAQALATLRSSSVCGAPPGKLFTSTASFTSSSSCLFMATRSRLPDFVYGKSGHDRHKMRCACGDSFSMCNFAASRSSVTTTATTASLNISMTPSLTVGHLYNMASKPLKSTRCPRIFTTQSMRPIKNNLPLTHLARSRVWYLICKGFEVFSKTVETAGGK
mmetsp:Transcript_65873/g.189970  ORF Transcript_65873/g.189970 Transcript_65873/m.189970 type:complete len:226 (+) Transcript_65873:4208-4885(+)